MSKSKIEWTDRTWNPLTGCDKISAGCKNCYAERLALRLQHNPKLTRYQNGFQLTLHPDLLHRPREWKKGSMVFVNSMSDLFHGQVPLDFIKQVFKTMNECPQHIFQVLTKRGDRLALLAPYLNWTPNIWMGVSVEDQRAFERIHQLLRVPAAVRWLSMEPLIGPVPNIPHLRELQWVVVGGESGSRNKIRPMREAWATDVRDQCQAQGVPFFFKQWGNYDAQGQYRKSKREAGNVLGGRIHDQMPEAYYAKNS